MKGAAKRSSRQEQGRGSSRGVPTDEADQASDDSSSPPPSAVSRSSTRNTLTAGSQYVELCRKVQVRPRPKGSRVRSEARVLIAAVAFALLAIALSTFVSA